jgi:hypothetical protein
MSIPCKSSTTDLINHIVFLIDNSGSMSIFQRDVIKVFDSQISRLAQKSVATNQETRVTIYFFDDTIECVVFDKDVLRLPSIADRYVTRGGTSLMDAMSKAIGDIECIPTTYGNHACLMFVITDGEERNSKFTTAEELSRKIARVSNTITVACLLPNIECAHEAKKYGINANNIMMWNTSSSTGVEEAGENIHTATDVFFSNRAAGISTKNIFKLDTTNLSTNAVRSALVEMDPSTYEFLAVNADAQIKPFVESFGKIYAKGCAYYQLTKKELVQSYKKICIRERASGKVFGGDNSRNLLNLPLDSDINISPDGNGSYDIFIESTSVNRKVLTGTNVLYLL